jgi:nicotinamide riboside kinase
MIKIAFAGAQDTGKTTLSKYISSKFTSEGYLTDYVSEAARELITKWGGTGITISDQLLITQKQAEKELLVAPLSQMMFTDSPIFISYVYTLRSVDKNSPKDIDHLLNIYYYVLKSNYDLIFFLPTFRSPTPDGVRSKELIEDNERISAMIQGFLDLHRLPYHKVKAMDLAGRMVEIERVIKDSIKIEPIRK